MTGEKEIHDRLKAAVVQHLEDTNVTTGPDDALQKIHDIAVQNGSACEDPDAPLMSGRGSAAVLHAIHRAIHTKA
jgi:hypothetical protein